MLITALITLGSIIAWAVTARALFRRLVRNTDLGYWLIAILTIGGAPLLPVLLPVIAFVAFVVRNPPLNQRELEEKTRNLEAENARLQQAQDGGSAHDCRDYDDIPHYDAFDQIIEWADCPSCGRDVPVHTMRDDECIRCWAIRYGVNPEDAH